MNNKYSIVDFSDELILQRQGEILKIIKPHDSINKQCLTIKDIFSFNNCNVYLFYGDSIILKMNEINSNLCGFSTETEAKGKSIYNIPIKSKNSAHITVKNNRKVLEKNRILFFDEYVNIKQDLHFISIKAPIYSDIHNLKGVFGCSFMTGRYAITNSMNKIIKFLFNQSENFILNEFNNTIDNSFLTKREKDCLLFTIKGKTAKEISLILNLSTRSIEKYLENIKTKMQVKTKSQLIEKTIKYFTTKNI